MRSRFFSIILSLCLHAGVIAVALFWPASAPPPVDLAAPVIDIDIFTIGRPGSAPVKVPSGPAAPPVTPAPPKAAPPQAPEKPVPPPQAPEKPLPPPVKPETQPIPIPEKPEEPPKPEPPKPEPAKPEAPKPQPQKAREKPEDVLRRALGDLGSQREPDPLARALGDMRSARSGQSAQGNEEPDGPGGSGGDGIGVVGSYMQSLVSRIKPNWEYAGRADRRNPTAVAEIRIAADGTIVEAVIVTSSGDNAFDGSVLKAIRDTLRVEPPPTADLTRVRVPFAYQALR